MKTILIGITSGIAAYKIKDLITLLQKENFEIDVIMTCAATQMIEPKEIEKILGKKVYTDLFPKNFNYKKVLQKREVEHIKLADSASIFIVAPATANVIAKMSCGIADDFLTTTLLATTAPILLCPSMNVHMWEHPATQENLTILQKRGVHILHPDSGALACGYTGVGRLPDVEKIKNEIIQIFNQCHPRPDRGSRYLYSPAVAGDKWYGKKILVTAGGTSIAIDSVRMITNRASGKMGKALAEVAYAQGADVVLLRSVTSHPGLDPGSRYLYSPAVAGDMVTETFETPDELYELIKRYAKDADIIFHTAAVSDFAPKEKLRGKIDSNTSHTLTLVPQRKIIDEIKRMNPRIFVVAFKAVVGMTEKEMIATGVKKLASGTVDAVVVNDVGKQDRGFMSDNNEVIVVQKKQKPAKIPLATKTEIAQKILSHLTI